MVTLNNISKIINIFFISFVLTSTLTGANASLLSQYQNIEFINTAVNNPFITLAGWPQIYSDGYDDSALDIGVDSQDNIIVTGYSFYGSDSDAYTIKYDNEGNIIWNVSYDSGSDDIGFKLAIDSQDNVFIFGYSGVIPVSVGDCFILKYSSDGVEQWNLTLHMGECSYPGGIAVDSNGNIVITGGSGIWQTNIFYWTFKMDNNGIELWNHTFHEASIDLGLGITVDSQDNIIATGYSAMFFIDNLFIIKYSDNGEIIWEKRYTHNEPWDITVDSEDNIIVSSTNYERDRYSMETIKCDKEGILMWKNKFDAGAVNFARSVTVDSLGNVITAGAISYTFPENYEHCIVVYNSEGFESCMKTSGVEGCIYGVAVDSLDNIFITGEILEGIYGFYTTKYTDITPPAVQLKKPKYHYLHVLGKPILPLLRKTIVVGKLIVLLEADEPLDVDYVDIYLDDQLMKTLTTSPFQWEWNNREFGVEHAIQVIAYDDAGTAIRIKLTLQKFF